MEIYLLALGLTLVIEIPCVMVLSPRDLRKRVVLDALLLNLFTHPLAYMAVQDFGAPFFGVEGLVIVVEGIGYSAVTRMNARRAWGVSLVANSLTLALSFLW